MLRVNSPTNKNGKSPRARMNLIKDSMTKVIGNPLIENA